ncbi:MAG: DedA family protein [Alphaproteobacteria bacterium]
MEAFATEVGHFIQANQAWAGPIMGLIVFGESLAVIGLLVPATALMILTGGLIGAGVLDGATILAWGIVGGVVGDAVSYYVGRWIGPSVVRRWPLNRHLSAVARARLFFRRFGWASIFFGRFLGPIRSTIPLVAGTMLMSHRKFQVANVLSALLWVPAMLAPGFLAARGMADLASFGESEIVIFVIGIVVISVIGTFIGIKVLKPQPRRRDRTA